MVRRHSSRRINVSGGWSQNSRLFFTSFLVVFLHILNVYMREGSLWNEVKSITTTCWCLTLFYPLYFILRATIHGSFIWVNLSIRRSSQRRLLICTPPGKWSWSCRTQRDRRGHRQRRSQNFMVFSFRIVQFQQRALSKTIFFLVQKATRSKPNQTSELTLFSASRSERCWNHSHCRREEKQLFLSSIISETESFFVLKCWNFKRTYTSSLKILHRQSMSSPMSSSMKPWE